jgi:exonuclease SbcC
LETEIQSLDFDPKLRERLQSESRETGQILATLETQINQQTLALQRQSDSLKRDLAEARVAKTDLGPASEELKILEDKLVSENYAEGARTRASELEAIIAELGYDTEAHATVDALVSQLSGYSDLHRSLLEANNRLPSEQQLLSTSTIELSRASEEFSKAQQKQIDIQRNLQALPASESTLRDAQANLNGIETNLDNHRIKIGVLNSQLQRCLEVEGLVKGLEKQRASLVDERGLYNELALAFGKNGIQALIIEDAIPQLEADANELLARLTDNRMSLRLELKEGRRVRGTDALSEELDLSISDELGTRGYETFSGGETFRINFALRIALSRLLARRSGAPLRILFIDEGFGSQDATGQERLTEAIQSIQDDFEKIIVITHIDHVKEAFPVRIEVTKTELGSTFEIV